MKKWTEKDGSKTMLVNSTRADKAQKELNERIASIKQSLRMMETELQKWESLTCPDWANVGDLGHIDNELIAVWEFMSEAD